MVINYYSDPDVRARMLEFLGGGSPERGTCRFLAGGDLTRSRVGGPRPPDELVRLWEEGREISRSLWDRKALIAHLSVEYVRFDAPAEPYLEPERALHLQRPVEWAVEAVLLDYGIKPLHLLAGPSHHFVWRIRRSSAGFTQLAKLGRVPATSQQFYAQPHPPHGNSVSAEWAAAFSGLGLVVEYVAHRVKELAGLVGEIRVELAVVETGPARHGSEAVSIGICGYGDPLTARVMCVPFSLYLKPWQQRLLPDVPDLEHLQPMFAVPLGGMNRGEDLEVLRDPGRVMSLARQGSARIPDQSKAMENLVAAYRKSDWSEFHDWFYSQEPDPKETWPATYDATPLGSLPGCARFMLEHPNNLLLQPVVIEHIVRVMLSLGWHPRHIAGLLWSKYERDFGWRDQWRGYDAALRADFCARVLAGQCVVGGDDLPDWNCRSSREQNLCFQNDCPAGLAEFRRSLLDRRACERLAGRPFNRLFVPEPRC